MVAENRICEVVEVGFTIFARVLLGEFPRCPSLDYCFTLIMDTRHRLAEAGDAQNSVLVMEKRLEQTLRSSLTDR